MNALEIVQQVTDELGLTRAASLIGSSDPDVMQFKALLNRLGIDLVTQFEWQRLNKEFVLQTVATQTTGDLTANSAVITNIPSTAGLSTQFAISGEGILPFAQIISVDSATQVTLNMPVTTTGVAVALQFSQVQYNLPSDWHREIPQTEWDRTNRWPLMGPQSPQDWQSFKSGVVYAGPRQRFRILGNTYTINPPPPNGLLFSFEYISKNWVLSNAGVGQATIQADTDTFLFSDSILVTGLKTQWKTVKGLDGSFDLSEFRTLLELSKSQDKSAKKLSLSPYGGEVLLSTMSIADGNWPGNNY